MASWSGMEPAAALCCVTLCSSLIHAQREVLWLNSGFCSHSVIIEMKESIIPFYRALLAEIVQVSFSYAKAAKLPPSYSLAVTIHSLRSQNCEWRNVTGIQVDGGSWCKLLSSKGIG